MNKHISYHENQEAVLRLLDLDWEYINYISLKFSEKEILESSSNYITFLKTVERNADKIWKYCQKQNHAHLGSIVLNGIPDFPEKALTKFKIAVEVVGSFLKGKSTLEDVPAAFESYIIDSISKAMSNTAGVNSHAELSKIVEPYLSIFIDAAITYIKKIPSYKKKEKTRLEIDKFLISPFFIFFVSPHIEPNKESELKTILVDYIIESCKDLYDIRSCFIAYASLILGYNFEFFNDLNSELLASDSSEIDEIHSNLAQFLIALYGNSTRHIMGIGNTPISSNMESTAANYVLVKFILNKNTTIKEEQSNLMFFHLIESMAYVISFEEPFRNFLQHAEISLYTTNLNVLRKHCSYYQNVPYVYIKHEPYQATVYVYLNTASEPATFTFRYIMNLSSILISKAKNVEFKEINDIPFGRIFASIYLLFLNNKLNKFDKLNEDVPKFYDIIKHLKDDEFKELIEMAGLNHDKYIEMREQYGA